jgi:hypothetical protein
MKKHAHHFRDGIGSSDWNYSQATINIQCKMQLVHMRRLEVGLLSIRE